MFEIDQGELFEELGFIGSSELFFPADVLGILIVSDKSVTVR